MRAGLAVALVALAAPLLAAAAESPAPLSANASAGGVLHFKVSGTAHGRNVLLKDVIEGELEEPLASLALKEAGQPGAKLTVAKALAQLKLRGAKNSQRLEGPDVCQLSVPVLSIPGADLQRFADDYMAKGLSGTVGASLQPQGTAKDLQTYDAPTSFNIKSAPADLRGNVVLRVQVLQSNASGEDHEVASVPVSYLVRRKEPRVYTTKIFRHGDLFDASGLTVKDDDTTFTQAQGFASVDEVLGKRARAYVAAGKALASDLVELPPLIKRGDIVRVIVKSGGIIIETSGKALRDARLGETLPLELESTHKQVQARCVEAGIAVRDAL